MQRLFSSFANGAPGAGLLLMRLAAGASLVLHAAATLLSSAPAVSTVFGVLMLAIALLLLVGLWTPVAGVLVAVAAGWHALEVHSTPGFDALLGIVGIAIALLGPGSWSVDAWLYGWKRVELRNGNGGTSKPPIR